ncbi:glycosyltransferase family 2 protein [Nocardiopsis changdeensis]|uniref:Glycosyltransferase n=1 Tax=Nocardiopsis changdeensis TaxID=2831969 RepID=A0ABX8BH07_9ACTN|nr:MULTISPECIES: glycosyltransferase [Nocardiopsis]QUX21500.1 glycosyltransferase [Nocardiopsis changdeensis]QYX37434.1 glycosyltransferase [Nocardiopsis sp. MT53]
MTTLETGREPAAETAPRTLPRGEADFSGQPRLVRNDYAPLTPAPLGAWTPTLSVSVVIPSHGHPEKLAFVLAALAGQSYPAHLMEVVVVDDGSPEPLVLPPVRPENTRLITSAPGGWGSAHAFHTGVAASSGQVILRLDADMLVYREHVESQMRWHHLVDYGVAMGHKLFVDFDPGAMTPEHVRDEVAAGRAEKLFDREGADTHWVEKIIDGSNVLRTAAHQAYRVFTGATGSLHRTLFDAAGGMDAEMVLGGDTEFAYRVSQQGAVFIPDLETSSWHLGRSQMQTRRDAGMRYRTPYVSNRVPDFRLRRKNPDRSWEVPYVDAVIDVRGRTLEDAEATAAALLNGTTPDLRLWLVGPWGELTDGRRSPLDEELLDLRLIGESFRGDPRVRLVEEAPEPDPRVTFVLHAPAGTKLTDTAVADMAELADKERAGLLCAPPPGATRAEDGVLRLERRAAFARVRHLSPDADGAAVDRAVEELYGAHWLSGEAFTVPEPEPGAPARRNESPEALRRKLEQAQAEVEKLRARARRAERKLRWFTPGVGRRVLRKIVR